MNKSYNNDKQSRNVREVPSQISLRAQANQIDTFRFYDIFCLMKVSSYQKYSLGGECRP